MKISVITVCLNAEGTIRGCLDSVAEQTHPDIEHLIIDGASNDGTVEIARSYPHVAEILSQRDSGLYDAMNKGVVRSNGDYVLFLNADDRLYSRTSLADAANAIKANRGGDVYYGWLEVRPTNGDAFVFKPPPPSEAANFLITGCLPHQSTLARPAVFKRTGPFDLRYRYHADYDWFLKIIADPTIDVRSLPCTIGSFKEGGLSSQLAKGQPEVYYIQNTSPLYANANWHEKRIAEFQQAWLRERISAAHLRGELLAYERAGSPKLEEIHREPGKNQSRHGPPYKRTRPYGKLIEILVQALPNQLIFALRRLRRR
jgi:glycosyltransferase involved in cell wall biosynthesis